MVIIDWLIKSVILIRIKNITIEDMVEVFFIYFYIYYGVPLAIISDHGPQFISIFWGRVCERLLIQYWLSTTFHPQIDGATERAN